MKKVNGTIIRKSSNGNIEQFEIKGFDYQTRSFVVVECNPVNGVARKNGKEKKLKVNRNNKVYHMQIEGKERIGQTSWNALYKGLELEEVKSYLGLGNPEDDKRKANETQETQENNKDSRVLDRIAAVRNEWIKGNLTDQQAMKQINQHMTIGLR